ncbi:hypothetical protein [uncultured Shewanella sp.]|uniref:hypothetical protein n=1 Tax=uncultured Shewanella sp. TaxID=173975 RepID=UPI00260264A1|nr:hypothetical protein [uncultured Shewanella sp.]
MSNRSSPLIVSSLFISAFLIMAFIISFIFFNHAIAAETDAPMPPKLPLAKMSLELDVTSDQLEMCMQEARPVSPGNKPNKAAMLTCLQNANPAITKEKLQEVMKKNMPMPMDKPQP